MRSLLALVLLAGCKDEPPPMACTPTGTASPKLLTLARRHRTLVEQRAPNRDVKLVDDELRLGMAIACQPCPWVGDRLTVDEMLPLGRLDDATAVTCLGLVLRDGSTVTAPSHR